jgi:hypothetical protein
MRKPQYIIIVVGVATVSGCLAASAGVGVGRMWERSVVERYELDAIAYRLQVEADWATIRAQVSCGILEMGNGRAAIEEQLRRVGPYHARRDSLHPYYTISFDNYFARLALGDLALAYVESDRLTETLRWVGIGETVPINCP